VDCVRSGLRRLRAVARFVFSNYKQHFALPNYKRCIAAQTSRKAAKRPKGNKPQTAHRASHSQLPNGFTQKFASKINNIFCKY